MKSNFLIAFAVGFLISTTGCDKSRQEGEALQIQLNWLHDPTFSGEYLLAKDSNRNVTLKEGGPNIFSIAEVSSGRVSAGIVGADVFLQALDKSLKDGKTGDVKCFFVDFQRNPVGWVLHPDAAARAGMSEEIRNNPAALNKWLFSKFADGTLKPGDKRGTETTSIWMQWKKLHNLSPTVEVIPVGFDTSVVLSAPMLAYPVYLNEEPFKLAEKIGRSVVVFDPAADGVELYGNVLVTSVNFADKNGEAIAALQRSLRSAWHRAKTDEQAAISEVMRFYKGVGEPVVRQQVGKTLEYAFYGGKAPGSMDLSPDGRWNKTLKALQEAELVSAALTFDALKSYIIDPQ